MDALTRAGTKGSRVDAIARHIVGRLAAAAEADLRGRYDVGCVAHAIRYEDDGATALQQLGDRLALDESALRRYARVSETLSASEFEWVVSLRTRQGLPLTWSHIELLQQVRSSPRRRDLANAAARDGCSVRELAARVRAYRFTAESA
jgi:hypothetical protein